MLYNALMLNCVVLCILPTANGAPVILVLYNAGPLDISWAKYSADVHAIVECFFPAQSAGVALYRLLTASAGPSSIPAARLPNTWPASLSHVRTLTGTT